MSHRLGVHHLLDALGRCVDYLGILHDDHVGIEIHRAGQYDGDTYLADNLVLAGDAVFVVLAQLLVVVEKTQRAQPQGGKEHQQHVHVGEIAHQQAGQHYGHYDDDAAHGGGAGLLGLALEVEVAHNLAHLHQLQALDDAAADKYCYHHRQHKGQPRAEGHVAHQSGAGHAGLAEYVKEIVKHLGGLS